MANDQEGVPKGPNEVEVEVTIVYLESSKPGGLGEVDAARVQAARSMAAQLDRNPDNASLWRQYREILKELATYDGRGLDAELERLFSDTGD